MRIVTEKARRTCPAQLHPTVVGQEGRLRLGTAAHSGIDDFLRRGHRPGSSVSKPAAILPMYAELTTAKKNAPIFTPGLAEA